MLHIFIRRNNFIFRTTMNSSSRLYLVFLAFLVALTGASALSCKILDQQTYTTTDGLVLTSVAYINQFRLDCGGNNEASLYADLNGRLLPVVRSSDGKAYEVSWYEDISKAPYGDFKINVYDDEGLAQLRKAQRDGTTAGVKPLLQVDVNHPGTYRGPSIQTEVLASLGAILLWYFAYSTKANLMK